jgi:hypothetical protein
MACAASSVIAGELCAKARGANATQTIRIEVNAIERMFISFSPAKIDPSGVVASDATTDFQ